MSPIRLARSPLLPALVALAALALPSPAGAEPLSVLRPFQDARAVRTKAVDAALSQTTRLTSAQVTTRPACPRPAPGHVACAAQVIAVRSTRRPVRASVRAQRQAWSLSLLRAVDREALPRPQAVQASRQPEAAQASPQGQPGVAPPEAGTPAWLEQAYDLSYLSATRGAGDTVAIVDAYDDPTAESDLAVYRSTYGLPPCTTAGGCFSKVDQTGQSWPLPDASPASPDWHLEESLDLDAVSSVCPNCRILLVEANSDSESDLQAAMQTAVSLGASQISDSWSGDEVGAPNFSDTWPGVTVDAATGDDGYLDPSGGDAYPAALPGVTAVGGTTLAPTASAAPRGFDESAWSDAGSGCDTYEAMPAWQPNAGCAGRAYADVSADANPESGLLIYQSGDPNGWNGWLLGGGTSLATPLTAAFEAITGAGGSPDWAYADAGELNDPQTGSNGDCALPYICNAEPGYDGPTGAGSISGAVVPGGPGVGGPTEGSSYATSVGATSAGLLGGVYPNSLATTYYWEYGTTAAYGSQTAAASAGAGAAPVSVTGTLTGLSPSTTYHYRLVAQNSAGTTYGYDYTLSTPASAPVDQSPPTIATAGPTLVADPGTWSPAGSVSYQWQLGDGRSWQDIAGADGSSYTPGSQDAGLLVRLMVSETNADGQTAAASAPAGPVAEAASHLRRPRRRRHRRHHHRHALRRRR